MARVIGIQTGQGMTQGAAAGASAARTVRVSAAASRPVASRMAVLRGCGQPEGGDVYEPGGQDSQRRRLSMVAATALTTPNSPG